MKSQLSNATELFGKNGFVFLDDAARPFLVTDKSGEWWLYFWRDDLKNFVTLRPLVLDEVNDFKRRALSPKKSALYAAPQK